MKKVFTTTIAALLLFSMIAVLLPSFSTTTYAAYYAKNINGGNVSSADFIFDPGHGGKDPGACLGSRKEAADVLRMAKRVGQLIIASGATVAFTRVTDVFIELSDRANIQKAGSYSCFVSFHRNAASGSAYGLETYHYPGSSSGQTLATQLQNALVALNIWRNRGVKSANYAVLRQTTIPAALIEIGFIDNPSENTIFDNNFEAMAKAIASALLKRIGKTLVSDDKTPPTVSNVQVSNVSKTGYKVTATVKDNVGVTSVKFPTWTSTGGQDDIKWLVGSVNGTTATCNIKVSDFGNKMDTYITHVYAYDAKGNSANAAAPNTLIENTPPVISNVSITNVTVNGYKISCKATDNVGVTSVKFPTWTSAGGQDDIVWHVGTKSGDTFSFTVNIKDHNYESGTYITHIYAYDALGNESSVNAPDTVVPADPTTTIVVSDKIMLTAINGDQWSDTGAYYWTTGTFKAVWWRVLAAVPDGRNYKVTAVYEANTGSKSVDPPSGGFLIAVHAADASYNTACKFNVGDHFTLYGVRGTTLSSGAYAGFGEFQSVLDAQQLVPTSSSKIKVGSDNVFTNVYDKLTVDAFLGNFEATTSTKKVYNSSGAEITAGSTAFVGTGTTVKLLDSAGKELKKYTVKVTGDVDGDGQITSNDYMAVKASFKSTAFAVEGIFAKAADTNGNGKFTITDYLAIKRFVAGKYTFVK